MGLQKVAPKRVAASTAQKLQAQATTLPASVDLTAFAPPAGDQGQVGSCAAWATDYTALGYWENVQGVAGGRLAPMYTYSQLVHGQNVGTAIDDHMVIAESQGVDVRSDYTQGDYDYIHTPTAHEIANAAQWKLSGHTDLAVRPGSSVTADSIKAALADGRPVVIGIPVYNNFFYVGSANHGYYAGISGGLAGYHAVTALGYSSTGLRIENQWGSGWGERGFATLSWTFVNGYVFQATSVGPLIAPTTTPALTTAPAISGDAVRARTLSVGTGTWDGSPTAYAYQWQRDSGSGFVDIANARTTRYVVQVADENARLRVKVTARNRIGTTVGYSAAVGPVAKDLPVATVAPAVTGDAKRGVVLRATGGTWTGVGNRYAYQWQRDSGGGYVDIPGARYGTYALQVADKNAHVRLKVLGVNPDGAVAAYSNAVGPVVADAPNALVAPVVTGDAKRGVLLHGTGGTWTGGGNRYAYQWQRDTGSGYVDIPGARYGTYALQLADEQAHVRLKVTASNPDAVVAAYSNAVGPVAADAPSMLAAPTVTGVARRNYVLSGHLGRWTGAGSVYTVQWQRDTGSGFVDIPGARAGSYKLQLADVGARVRLKVVATNPDGRVEAYTAGIGPVSG
jgi:hypothetical protein